MKSSNPHLLTNTYLDFRGKKFFQTIPLIPLSFYGTKDLPLIGYNSENNGWITRKTYNFCNCRTELDNICYDDSLYQKFNLEWKSMEVWLQFCCMIVPIFEMQLPISFSKFNYKTFFYTIFCLE